MTELLNVASGKPEDLPDEQVYKALAQGTHTPVGGAKPLIDPDGRLVFSPANDVQDSVQKYSYKLPTQADLDAFAHQQEFGEGTGNELKAFGEGAARGATFGATDYLLPKTGLTTKEALAARKELNPSAALAGEVTGAVGSALALPGSSPAGLVAKGSELAGEGIAGALKAGAGLAAKEGGLASKVLQGAAEVGGKAAGSAIEGSAYGLGQSVSEASLGDEGLNAEHVLANVGYGALLGGWLGAVLGTAGKAIPAALGKAQDVIGNTYSKLIGGMEDVAGPLQEGAERGQAWNPGVVSKAWAKVSSAASGEPEDAIIQKMREAHSPTGEPMTLAERDKFAKDASDSLQEHYNAINKASKDAAELARPQESAALLEGADPAKAMEELQATRQLLKTTIDEMRQSPELYPARFPSKMEQIAEGLDRKTHIEGEVMPHLTAADTFKAINEAKQAIDTKIPWGKEISGESADAVDLIKSLRSNIKDSLEKEDAWGAAGARQAAYNNAVSDAITAKSEFQKRFMYKVKTKSGGVSYKIDPIKVKTWFNQINDARGLRSSDALKEYLSTSRNLVSEMGKSYEHAPFEEFDQEGLNNLIDKHEDTALRAKNVIEAQPGGFGVLSDVFSGAKGIGLGMASGPLGLAYAAKKGFDAIHNPGGAIQKLVRIERAVQKSTNLINTAAKTAVNLTETATKGIPGAGMVGEKLDAETRLKQYNKRVEKIQKHMADPQQFMDTLEASTKSGFNAAPKVMGGIQDTAIQATQFLASKIPQPAYNPLPLDKPFEPSSTQIVKFNRYYEAVNHPATVLHQLKHNIVLPESMEAVQTVYPKLFSHMQEQVTTHLIGAKAKRGNIIPYQKRMALGKFLGQPLDNSLTPKAVAANQASIASPSKSNDETQAKPVAGASAITLSNRVQTPFQRAERDNT